MNIFYINNKKSYLQKNKKKKKKKKMSTNIEYLIQLHSQWCYH